MTPGVLSARAIIGVIGALMMLAGAFLFVLVGPLIGGWLIVSGAVLVVAVIIERSRYRSQAAERTHMTPGPGGGEPGPVDSRFRPTDEVFVDPTSNRRMRVYVDSSSGERRYVAEG
ncbi:MAG TPA: hypothetical protein VH371_07545 [Candidatus Limnocylindrales bacterium]|jgi:hypothetical protein